MIIAKTVYSSALMMQPCVDSFVHFMLRSCLINSFIHSRIYIAPLQGKYSEVVPRLQHGQKEQIDSLNRLISFFMILKVKFVIEKMRDSCQQSLLDRDNLYEIKLMNLERDKNKGICTFSLRRSSCQLVSSFRFPEV